VRILNRNLKILNFDLMGYLAKNSTIRPNYPSANIAQNVAEVK
jgi:hypothetical protein